jgi:hypothetical protein
MLFPTRELNAHAEQQERDAILQRCCIEAGIGIVSATSRQRDADTVRRRAIVAWLLRQKGWTQEDIGAALRRTARQTRRLLQR